MATRTLPPQAVLLQLFRYEPETGRLFWKERDASFFQDGERSAGQAAAQWNGKNAGRLALDGTSGDGYRTGRLFGVKAKAHRVIWKILTGVDASVIDHIDGDPTNNRPSNLRSVTQNENGKNARVKMGNKTGVTGVYWNVQMQKWQGQIGVNGKRVHLGLFNQFHEAVAARKAAELEYGFHENHGRAA